METQEIAALDARRPVVAEERNVALTVRKGDPVQQAFRVLHAGFVAAPALAGLDKFFDALCAWEKYLAPQVAAVSPVKPRTFMKVVGVVEIAAAGLVAARPKLGGYVVAGWLGGIIGNLLLGRRHYDIALRDFGLLLGALALARLADAEGHPAAARRLS